MNNIMNPGNYVALLNIKTSSLLSHGRITEISVDHSMLSADTMELYVRMQRFTRDSDELELIATPQRNSYDNNICVEVLCTKIFYGGRGGSCGANGKECAQSSCLMVKLAESGEGVVEGKEQADLVLEKTIRIVMNMMVSLGNYKELMSKWWPLYGEIKEDNNNQVEVRNI